MDVVRATFEAFRRRDLDAFLSCFDPEVEYRSLVLEVEGIYHGHEGMRSWWGQRADGIPRLEPAARAHTRPWAASAFPAPAQRGTDGSGIPLERDIWHVAEIRDGRIKSSALAPNMKSSKPPEAGE